jgi:DNA sulfur modification protein DndB
VTDPIRKNLKRILPSVKTRSQYSCLRPTLGGVGRIVLEKYPGNWQQKLKLLERMDWRKSVDGSANPLWDAVCITAGSVVSNRQAGAATLAS